MIDISTVAELVLQGQMIEYWFLLLQWQRIMKLFYCRSLCRCVLVQIKMVKYSTFKYVVYILVSNIRMVKFSTKFIYYEEFLPLPKLWFSNIFWSFKKGVWTPSTSWATQSPSNYSKNEQKGSYSTKWCTNSASPRILCGNCLSTSPSDK